MEEQFEIVSVDEPDWATIGGGIAAFNVQQTGDREHRRFCYVLRDADNETVGGVIAEVYWGWMYLDLLFVKEELRGRGFGHQLLVKAEEYARQLGARNVYLDTFTFQAPSFYKAHGYEVFGELKEFPAGHQRYFMTKRL